MPPSPRATPARRTPHSARMTPILVEATANHAIGNDLAARTALDAGLTRNLVVLQALAARLPDDAQQGIQRAIVHAIEHAARPAPGTPRGGSDGDGGPVPGAGGGNGGTPPGQVDGTPRPAATPAPTATPTPKPTPTRKTTATQKPASTDRPTHEPKPTRTPATHKTTAPGP